jgi:asparagine synthase (glutamine-hydrolysing)
MSGICGLVNFDGAPVGPDLLRKMAETVAYRGPDGIHYWVNGNVGFAHLALNATPESLRETQPLVGPRGNVVLIADARVDNRDELISTLTAKGYLQEKDPTDADLILAAYECWGETCPEHIIGDFAFAVWDARKQQLFCARDALGIKPLHYAWAGRTLCVASEAQQILQHPAVPCRLNEVAMADYLVGCFDDEQSTLFVDVQRLPPANRLIATQTGSHTDRYWDIDPAARIIYRRDEDYATHFLDLFRRAVSDRLRTQAGTVGITMSGGLDSCSVAAIAQQTLTRSNGSPRLVAYSYAFDRLKECDERTYSRAMAAELGIEVKYIDAERFWFLGDPVAFCPSLETPFLGWESLERNMLSRLQDQGGRVLLTGQGGDSLLWGSARVYVERLRQGQVGVLWELSRHARERQASYPRLLYTYLIRPLLPEVVIRTVRHLIKRDKASPPVPSWIAADFVQRTGLSDRLADSRLPRRFHSLSHQAIYELVIQLGSVKNVSWSP